MMCKFNRCGVCFNCYSKHFNKDCFPCEDVDLMTNADRIRSMTDEELAWELMLWRCEAVARHHGISSVYPDTQKTILEWLQQPAEEDKHETD